MTEDEGIQRIYTVNCNNCSNLLKVVNPRLHELPAKVYPTQFGFSIFGEIVRVNCPHCGKEVWVKFDYK